MPRLLLPGCGAGPHALLPLQLTRWRSPAVPSRCARSTSRWCSLADASLRNGGWPAHLKQKARRVPTGGCEQDVAPAEKAK